MLKRLLFVFFILTVLSSVYCFSQNDNRNDFLYPQIYGSWVLERSTFKNSKIKYPYYYREFRFRRDGTAFVTEYRQFTEIYNTEIFNDYKNWTFRFEDEDTVLVTSVDGDTIRLNMKSTDNDRLYDLDPYLSIKDTDGRILRYVRSEFLSDNDESIYYEQKISDVYTAGQIIGTWFPRNPEKLFTKFPLTVYLYRFSSRGARTSITPYICQSPEEYPVRNMLVYSDYHDVHSSNILDKMDAMGYTVKNNVIIFYDYESVNRVEVGNRIKILNLDKGILTLEIDGQPVEFVSE